MCLQALMPLLSFLPSESVTKLSSKLLAIAKPLKPASSSSVVDFDEVKRGGRGEQEGYRVRRGGVRRGEGRQGRGSEKGEEERKGGGMRKWRAGGGGREVAEGGEEEDRAGGGMRRSGGRRDGD